ncbi:MAG: serine hydrolase domain-containing protein [Microthrixaceae bacterium]
MRERVGVRRAMAGVAIAITSAMIATACVGPQLEPPRLGDSDASGDNTAGDGLADSKAPENGTRCEMPGGTYFDTAGAENVALDRTALERAVAYATARGAQSVRIYRHGCLIARGGNDWFTERQRLPAWSMTKGVVSTIVGRAEHLGILGVDDPIGQYLDGLSDDVGDLTIRHFLTQTSGLRMAWVNDLWAAGTTDSVADVLARPFQADPGSTFIYAQTAVTVLVAILEAASGEDFQAFAERELFRRIGITGADWFWDRDGSGRTQGFAFLDMTPIAWARLGHLLLNEGRWGPDRLLSAEYVAQGSSGTDANPAYGFLWRVNSGDFSVDSGFPNYERDDGPHWPGLPSDAIAFSGLFDQDTIVIPSLDMVVVRMGLPPQLFGDPLGESPGARPDYAWRFHRLLMHSVIDVDVADPGPWTYDGPSAPVDPANIIEATLPPFEWQIPAWLS